MNKRLIAAAALAAFANLTSGVAQAATYDATAEFNKASNPNGVWSYGYSLEGGATYSFILFDTVQGDGRVSSTYQSLGAPGIWRNAGSGVTNGVAPGALSLHPGPQNDSPAVLRFTAPTAGEYTFDANFYPGDFGDMNAAVFINGDASSPYYATPHTDPMVTTKGQTLLKVGGTLDFVVGNNGSFYYGNTPLSVHVATVPEPATTGLALAGLLIAGIAARRRMM